MNALELNENEVKKNLEDNQKNVRKMVMESYQDMLDGKGRSSKVFFEKMERKYTDENV